MPSSHIASSLTAATTADCPSLSLVITTFNNAATIEACIRSVPFASEIIVLDSFSTDETVRLAKEAGAQVKQSTFAGYGPQKQAAVQLASHNLVLLLDADETLSLQLQAEIETLLRREQVIPPCRLLREEWLYWQWPRPGTALTDHLRLFDRRVVRWTDHPVHAAPTTDKRKLTLKSRLRHYGHANIAGQVERINHYTSGAADPAPGRSETSLKLGLLLAPPAAFVREYLLRRQFLNGWAGFIASRLAADHAFLRYAKKLESIRLRSSSEADLP